MSYVAGSQLSHHLGPGCQLSYHHCPGCQLSYHHGPGLQSESPCHIRAKYEGGAKHMGKTHGQHCLGKYEDGN